MQGMLATGLAQDGVVAASEAQAVAFWRLRDSISEAERAEGPTMAHDISVPVDAMPDFMLRAAVLVEAAFPGVHASAFGHLGDGNVHFHVNAPPGVDAARWRSDIGEPASHMIYDLVVRAGRVDIRRTWHRPDEAGGTGATVLARAHSCASGDQIGTRPARIDESG